ncbi:MAG: peptidoglycan-binding domain-containing protein, partial [Methanofastidiosum sp.]
CTKEKYAELINMAVPITHSYGFKVGAGNEEFITAQARGNMYQYILANSNFDILDIHIQGSCDSKEKIEYWTNTARSWTKKPIDCTEAFYGNVATQYDLLVTQMENAERIGCDNFCNVFNNLDTSVFPILKNQQVLSKWTELSFKVNGILRTDKFWEWKRLMSSKAPIPNIKKGVLGGMIIKTIGHKTTDVKSGYGVELLHELLLYKGYMNEDDIENKYVYDEETRKAVESFQADLKINVDGRVGRQTWRKFISSIEDSTVKKDFQFNLEVVMSPYNANGDT